MCARENDFFLGLFSECCHFSRSLNVLQYIFFICLVLFFASFSTIIWTCTLYGVRFKHYYRKKLKNTRTNQNVKREKNTHRTRWVLQPTVQQCHMAMHFIIYWIVAIVNQTKFNFSNTHSHMKWQENEEKKSSPKGKHTTMCIWFFRRRDQFQRRI